MFRSYLLNGGRSRSMTPAAPQQRNPSLLGATSARFRAPSSQHLGSSSSSSSAGRCHAVPLSSRSHDTLGAEAHKSLYDASSIPTFDGWAPEIPPGSEKLILPVAFRSDGTAVFADLHQYADVADLPPASPSSPASPRPAPSTDEALDQILQCFITHPGSITCTAAAVHLDEETGTVTLSHKATVRKTEDCSMSNLDLEELGWLALESSASQRAASVKAMANIPGIHDERHLQIVELLKHGVVVDAIKKINDFGHLSYVVTLEDRRTCQRCKALFKPRMEGDGEGWHRVPIEEAAYRLNLLLGMDYVPPAFFRKECDVDWNHFEEGGTFIYWCPAAQELAAVPLDMWGCRQEVLLSDTRILDVLIQNSDRHAGHFMWADHWAKGSFKGGRKNMEAWRGRRFPVLIDQAAGFRPEAFVCLDHENAFSTGPTRCISAKTYMRLRFLDHATVSQALGEFISEEEVRQLLQRKDTILAYFDQLVQDKGYHAVVLEEAACDAPTSSRG